MRDAYRGEPWQRAEARPPRPCGRRGTGTPRPLARASGGAGAGLLRAPLAEEAASESAAAVATSDWSAGARPRGATAAERIADGAPDRPRARSPDVAAESAPDGAPDWSRACEVAGVRIPDRAPD
eukprot:1177937-Prorocentrum_minimum.AAC.4